MKDLIMQIVKALVDQPDEVQIKEVDRRSGACSRTPRREGGSRQGDRQGRCARLGDPNALDRHQRQGKEALHPRDHRVLTSSHRSPYDVLMVTGVNYFFRY